MKNTNIRSENGVTMVALVTTIIIMVILLSVISFSAKNGIEVKKINDMYTDVLLLEEKTSLYYLEHGALPVKGTPIDDSVIPEEIKNYNPNDSKIYYEIDVSKLDNITLNNGRDSSNAKDKYIIDSHSHTIYYLAGIDMDEYIETSVTKVSSGSYYTIPREYQEIKVDDVIAEVEVTKYKTPRIDVAFLSIDGTGTFTLTAILKNPTEVAMPMNYKFEITGVDPGDNPTYTELQYGTEVSCTKKLDDEGLYYYRVTAISGDNKTHVVNGSVTLTIIYPE